MQNKTCIQVESFMWVVWRLIDGGHFSTLLLTIHVVTISNDDFSESFGIAYSPYGNVPESHNTVETRSPVCTSCHY